METFLRSIEAHPEAVAISFLCLCILIIIGAAALSAARKNK